jgi:hypothetical protein
VLSVAKALRIFITLATNKQGVIVDTKATISMMTTTINIFTLTTTLTKTFGLVNKKQQLNPIRYHEENRIDENTTRRDFVVYGERTLYPSGKSTLYPHKYKIKEI